MLAKRAYSARRHFALPFGAFVVTSALVSGGAANAAELSQGQDWTVKWDNTVTYNLGLRAEGIDPKIGNNRTFHQSDYKFSKTGDIVTNRFSLMTELDAVYKGEHGFRVSGALWKDFAYDRQVQSNPGQYIPGVPYSAVTSFPNGYSSYYDKFYRRGGELLDAFVFTNFDLGDIPASVKLGRQNVYWGNAIFAGNAISYSQGPLDLIKGFQSPGTPAKELFLPRAQFLGQFDLTRELSVAVQYFMEFRPNRLPDGGTYLGSVDPLFEGATQLAIAPGLAIPRGKDFTPPNNNSNFGVALKWSPMELGSTFGFYYRKTDEVMPWVPMFAAGGPPLGMGNYHLSYAEGTQLFGVSLDNTIGPLSTGFEVSYRKNGALGTQSVVNPNDTAGRAGARGDTLNVVANALYTLTPTPFYQTGTLMVEAWWQRLLKVRQNAQQYWGEGYGGCPPGDDYHNGCSSKDSVGVAIAVEPQWLQVMSGVDLSAPMKLIMGVAGNGASVEMAGAPGSAKGVGVYSLGLTAKVANQYTIALAYNDYVAKTTGIALTPSGLPYYSTGLGPFHRNDRGWVSLTLQGSF